MKIYIPNDVHNMSDVEVMQYAIRQAEKYNKQLYRAEKAGYSSELYLLGGSARISKANIRKMSRPELEVHIQDVERRFAVPATKKSLQEYRESIFQDLEDTLGNGSGVIRQHIEKHWSKISNERKREIIDRYKRISSKARSFRDAYYDALIEMVERKKIDSYAPEDRAGTFLDYKSNSVRSIERALRGIERVLDNK